MALVLFGVWFQAHIINEPLECNIKRYFKRFILSVDQSIIPSNSIYHLHFVSIISESINNISMRALKEGFFLTAETFC